MIVLMICNLFTTLSTWAIFVILAYLIGGIPFGYLIGRMRGIDVRTVGSKNIGATNVYRTVGPKWGFLAFALDFLKGFVPAFIAWHFASGDGRPVFAELPIVTGLACVIGHTLTIYMNFKGGKGVATAFGMLCALIPYAALASFLLFVITVWLSHYISLGSILAAAFLAVIVWFDRFDPCCTLTVRIVVGLIGLFVIYKHKTNIQRLRNHCENRIY